MEVYSSTLQSKVTKGNTPDENFHYYQKYYLIKNNNAYKFQVRKLENEILIKCKDYGIKLSREDLYGLTKKKFNTIDESFAYIINIFEQNNVFLKEISFNKRIKITIKINNNNAENEIDIALLYENNNMIENESNNSNYNELKNDINSLKYEIEKIINDLDILKSNIQNNAQSNIINKYYLNDKNDYQKNNSYTNDEQSNIVKKNLINDKNENFIDIVNNSFASKDWIDNAFTVFKSIDNILYLIYSTENKSIISYNLVVNKCIKETKNAHNKFITNLKHYLDSINNRDLIISISFDENNLKLWNFSKNECLCNINNINKSNSLVSACIINDKKQNYIITNGTNYSDNIKIFYINGKLLEQMSSSNETTNFIESFYDNKIYKNYIVTCNEGYVKSYDFSSKKFIIYDDNSQNDHSSLIINNDDKIVRLIEGCWDGNIRIWNFHSGKLLKRIKVFDDCLNSIGLWGNEYIFIGCSDKKIRFVDFNKGKIVKELSAHNNSVITVKKIIHPNYGQCLLSQGANKDSIKLWIFKN